RHANNEQRAHRFACIIMSFNQHWFLITTNDPVHHLCLIFWLISPYQRFSDFIGLLNESKRSAVVLYIIAIFAHGIKQTNFFFGGGLGSFCDSLRRLQPLLVIQRHLTEGW